MANSIDILDECLGTIYKVRKLSLQNRKNRYDHKKSKSINQINVNSNAVQDTKGLGAIKKKLNIYPTSDDSSDENSDLNQTTSPSKDKTYKKEKPSIEQTDKYSALLDLGDSDTIAQNAFREFSLELKLWWDKSSTTIKKDDEAREQFADFLSEKYMCLKLDPLPPTKYVTQIRRDISRIIDEFAIKGILSSETASVNIEPKGEKVMSTTTTATKPITQHNEKTIAVNPTNKLPNSTGNKPPDTTGNTNLSQSGRYSEKESEDSSQESKFTSNLKNGISSTVTNKIPSSTSATITAMPSTTNNNSTSSTSITEKREKEKKKMQEQYQAYMKMKSNNTSSTTKDIIKIPDTTNSKQSNIISSNTEENDKATKLYENNVDEIQNLLNSIKGKF